MTRVLGMQPKSLHEHVSGCGEQHAKLIRQEAGATGAIDLEPELEFLDPILGVTSIGVDVAVDPARRLFEIRDDEAWIVLGFAPGESHHLGFDDDSSRLGPRLRRIVALAVHVLGDAALLREPLCLRHRASGLTQKDGVFGHPDDIIEPRLGVEKVEDLGRSEAGIEADTKTRFWKCDTQILDEPSQDRDGAVLVGRVAGSQDRGTQILLRLAIEGDEPEHRQEAPRTVEAIEQSELLGTVRWIHGRIEIDGDAPCSTTQATAMLLDDPIGQRGAHAIERQRAKTVLETRQGRLRSQRVTADRISTNEQLVDRIMCKTTRIVAVGVAACQTEDPLAEEIGDLVAHASESAGVVNAVGDPGRQPESLVDGLQQDGPSIGAGVGFVKGRHDWPRKKSWKQKTLCRRIRVQEKASSVRKSALDKLFLARGGFFVFNFVNNPG